MNKNELNRIIRYIKEDVIRAARQIMSSDTGVNEKVGFNTLVGSNLYNQIKSAHEFDGDNIVIDTIFNHYITFVEWDRPPMYKKRPPTDAIIEWLKRKRICSTNENIRSVAFLISRSIWLKGHKGRKIFEKLEKYVDSGFEEQWADMLFDAVTEDIDKWFSK